MAFETEGTIHKIFDTESKSATFQAREFVIKQDGIYPQFIKFQLTQDKCDVVNNYKEGDVVKVSFDLKGREWNEKYFTNLNAWKIDKVGGNANEPASTPVVENTGPPNSFDTIEPAGNTGQTGQLKVEDFGDLPF